MHNVLKWLIMSDQFNFKVNQLSSTGAPVPQNISVQTPPLPESEGQKDKPFSSDFSNQSSLVNTM